MIFKILNAIKNIGLSSIIILVLLLTGLFFSLLVLQTPKQTYAFPSAEGYGSFAQGGRGGVIYHVRTLEDTGKLGSLRYAVEQKGPRTIVFDIAGIIELKSPLIVKDNDLTIAGQTAPEDGICVKNYPFVVDADNVIIRYMRFRLGDLNNKGSALVVKNRHDVMIDHCSISWAPDDNITLYNNQNLTMQWCIISEALNNNNAQSGTGATLGGYSASYHHNLFASNRTNNPTFYKSDITNTLNIETVDFRNNVLYNWATSSINGAESGNYNLVNNYYKFGPATKIPSRSQILEVDAVKRFGIVHVSGNYVHTNPLQTNDNWLGVYPNMDYMQTSKNPLLTRFEFEHAPVTTHGAIRAYDNVLEYAGASLNRDFVDSRIAQSVETYVSGTAVGNGIIASPKDVGGYPSYKFNKPVVDSDGDGIPDDWEFSHNLNPYDPGDGKTMTKSGYTNLEVYLNSLVAHITERQNKGTRPGFDTLNLLVQKVANKVKKY